MCLLFPFQAPCTFGAVPMVLLSRLAAFYAKSFSRSEMCFLSIVGSALRKCAWTLEGAAGPRCTSILTANYQALARLYPRLGLIERRSLQYYRKLAGSFIAL